MVLVYGNPLANVAGYHKSDWTSPLPVMVPLFPVIKSAEYTHAFVFSGRLHILYYSCVNLAWVLFAPAGTMAMAVRKRFWDYAKTYPAEAIFSFAGTFPLFLFSNSAPMWEFFFFPRFL
ncbi:MAG TPA: hypothetical protein VGI36_18575 [Candidatus Binataceae bacterium]